MQGVVWLVFSLCFIGVLLYTDVVLYTSRPTTICNTWNSDVKQYKNAIPILFANTLVIHAWLALICFSWFVDTIGYSKIIKLGDYYEPIMIYTGLMGTLDMLVNGIVTLIECIHMQSFGKCMRNIPAAYYMVWNLPGVVVLGSIVLVIVGGIIVAIIAGLWWIWKSVYIITTYEHVDDIDLVKV